MSTLQATLLMVKPDVQVRGLLEELEDSVAANGLLIVALATIAADLDFIRRFYRWDIVEYPDHIRRYLCREPLKALVLVGDGAVASALKLRRQFRSKHQNSLDKLHTLLHCSDSSEAFEHESSLVTERTMFVFYETAESGRASQVQVIPYAESPAGPMILLMQRNEKRGGFWQVITGGVKPGENVMLAGFREMYEETKVLPMELLGPIYEYDFTESTGTLHESVFIGKLDECRPPTLSDEHTAYRWVTPKEAMGLLKWPGNKAAMQAFIAWCQTKKKV